MVLHTTLLKPISARFYQPTRFQQPQPHPEVQRASFWAAIRGAHFSAIVSVGKCLLVAAMVGMNDASVT